jgi:hypothetical protein
MAAKIDNAAKTDNAELQLDSHGLPHWHGKCYYLLFVWLA